MKKMKNGSGALWEVTLRISEGEKVDLNDFSSTEQKEIQENLEVIQILQKEDLGPEPSKTSFNELLSNLPAQSTRDEEEAQGESDWKNFFQKVLTPSRRWAIAPVLGMMMVGFMIFRPENIQVHEQTAETLSAEIQQDFAEFYRDFEEFEGLTKDLFAEDQTISFNQLF